MARTHQDHTGRDRGDHSDHGGHDRSPGGRSNRLCRTLLAGLALCATALVAACTVDLPGPGDGTVGTPVGLVRAGSCGALRERLEAGVDRGRTAVVMEDDTPSVGAAPGAPARAVGPVAGEVVAGTNVQEAGVDESDLAATDGRRIVSVTDGVLRVVTLDGTPAVDGRLDLRATGATELLLDGDRALVVGQNGEVTLTLVDLVAEGGPTVLRQRSVAGSLVAVRRHDGAVRVVVRSWPTPEVPMPLADGRPLGRCGDVLVPATAAVTPMVMPDAPGVAPGVATDVATPGRTTVLSPDAGLDDLRPVTVDAPANAVYASPTALYVAGATYGGTGPGTTVHRFELSGEGAARYTGSGSVEGTLLDRYSLSEDRGDLRVVTTVQPSAVTPMAGGGDPVAGAIPEPDAARSRGRLTVLRPGPDGSLTEVGRLDGLGPNEAVEAVRFMGERAYVVTFRRTDPLFALDLSDPTAPRVLGELKVPGFSEYLHPVGDGLLMGVGSDADPMTGMVTGAKVSLFDVSDPAAPRELDTLAVPGARSEVADEPRAFTWDPVHEQAVVPLERWGAVAGTGPTPVPEPVPEPSAPEARVPGVPGVPAPELPASVCPPDGCAGPVPPVDRGDRRASVVGVEGGRLVVRGELRHVTGTAGTPVSIRRSVVVGDDLWTVSSAGLGRTDARTPTTLTLLPWE